MRVSMWPDSNGGPRLRIGFLRRRGVHNEQEQLDPVSRPGRLQVIADAVLGWQ